MSPETIRRHRTFALVAVVAIAAWATTGIIDRRGSGHAEPLFQPDFTILHVPEGGALESAGFLPGDSVLTVEGIPVGELGMYSRWPRSLSREPGESVTIVVLREGEQISGDIVYQARAFGDNNLALGGMAIVLSFLIAGLWALFTTENPHAVRLAYIGLVLGAAVPGPSLGSWDGITSHLQVAAFVLWTILLLRFFLLFPIAKRAGTSRAFKVAIYAPWVVLLFCLVLELVYHPRFYHTFGPLYSLLMFAYVVLAVWALIHTKVKVSKNELERSGMRIIFIGVVVALAGTLVAAVDWMFLWNFDIPGSGWLAVLIGVIPISIAMAVRKAAGEGLS